MSTWKRKHLPVSVRQRLQNLRAKTGEDYQLLLTTYAVERLLLSAAEGGGGYNQVWRDGGPWKPRS